jgi:hypothetical protein
MVTMRRFRPQVWIFLAAARFTAAAPLKTEDPASGRPAFRDLAQPVV